MIRAIVVSAAVVAAWAAVTWPQARHMTDMVGGHVDALFSVWRLAWIDAALRSPRLDLWDAPIFFPASTTLAYSDAVLMPGALAAIIGALGFSPVTTYNLVLALFIVGAGMATAILVRWLTGRWLAGLAAAVIFALNPHQAEHFERLEIQTGLWIPLLFVCWHHAVARSSRGWALAATLCLAGQWLSGMYFGLFLFAALGCLALTWTWFADAAARHRVLSGAAAGVAVSLLVVAITARPYLEARAIVGERSADETARYSAAPADFVSVPPRNLVHGSWLPHGEPERALFPGALATVLAVVGAVAAPAPVRWLYLAVAAVALELTLGMNGVLFPWLREWLVPLRGIRAPARAATLFMLPVAVFAGIGAAALLGRVRPGRGQAAAGLAMFLFLVAEYRMTPLLWGVPPPDPKVAVDLTPASVIAEFPMPPPERLDSSLDAHYMVERIGLWPRLVNGSSGAYPPHYVTLLHQVRNFPDGPAIRALRHIGVTHVTVHERFLTGKYDAMLEAIRAQPDLVRLGNYQRPGGEVTVFALLDPRTEGGR